MGLHLYKDNMCWVWFFIYIESPKKEQSYKSSGFKRTPKHYLKASQQHYQARPQSHLWALPSRPPDPPTAGGLLPLTQHHGKGVKHWQGKTNKLAKYVANKQANPTQLLLQPSEWYWPIDVLAILQHLLNPKHLLNPSPVQSRSSSTPQLNIGSSTCWNQTVKERRAEAYT